MPKKLAFAFLLLVAAAAGAQDAQPLQGETGRVPCEAGDTLFFLDVDGATAAFELRFEGTGDIQVSREGPDPEAWGWLGWLDGSDEELVVGGRGKLPPGRYWVEVSTDEDGGVLAWRRSAESPGLPAAPLPPEALPLVFARDEACLCLEAAHDLSGRHLQLLHATHDLDLYVLRADTGEILQRAHSYRWDEHLRIDAGSGIVLLVRRWHVDRAGTEAELHVGADVRPAPPAGYLPPYAEWGDDGWSRMLASAAYVSAGSSDGSGVVIAPDGLTLTAWHVLADDLDEEILIGLPRSEREPVRPCFRAEIVAKDEDLDLALLRPLADVFDRPLPDSLRLPFVPLAGAVDLRLGHPLRVVGYPSVARRSSDANLCVLAGAVAAFETAGGELAWIVTDARAAGGNSGGGVFDADHRLVGVHLENVYDDDTDNLSFVLPVTRIPDALLRHAR